MMKNGKKMEGKMKEPMKKMDNGMETMGNKKMNGMSEAKKMFMAECKKNGMA